jgi:hypothetical protein
MSLATYQSTETQALAAVFGDRWRDMVARIVWGILDACDPETPVVTVKRWGLAFTFRLKHVEKGLALLGFARPEATA